MVRAGHAPRRSVGPGRPFLALLALLCLAGCWVPSDFEARVTLDGDGAYSLRFDGDLIQVLGFAEIHHAGRADPDVAFEALLASMRDDPGTRAASYRGEAAFRLRWEISGRLAEGETVSFPRRGQPLLVLARDEGGVTLQGQQPGRDMGRVLRRLGLRPSGRLEVRARGAGIDHNAETEPGLFSPAHVWRFEDFGDPAPFLRVSTIP